ncbi:MAG: hypothetical protein HKO89_03660 [Saprospiraceae bacterium]|nr:hypothetical protein [Saprospiraceae bacterium]
MNKFFPFFTFLLLLSSCSIFDSSDDVPMYVQVNSASLSTTPNQGSNSNKINDVSVYTDGFTIGLFPLGRHIPVLDENNDGMSTVNIFPVIRKNGQKDNPIQYPFYNSHEFIYPFEEDKLIPLDLEFQYVENASFIINEDFEGSHIIKQSIDGIPETEFKKSGEAEYGLFCGKMTTTEDHPFFEEATSFRYKREDLANSPIFMELDYKNDIPFRVGVVKYSGLAGSREYKIILTESSEWNKIYLELTSELGGNDYDEFQILFGAPGSGVVGNVWIDNIKILVLK